MYMKMLLAQAIIATAFVTLIYACFVYKSESTHADPELCMMASAPETSRGVMKPGTSQRLDDPTTRNILWPRH